MTYYSISNDIDQYYNRMSRKAKVWSVVGLVILVLLMLTFGVLACYYSYQRNKAVADLGKELEKSKQNYYIQSISNSNLEKKLQDLNLELAKLRNSTISLEQMLMELQDDKMSLEEIRRQMEIGIRRTKIQLDNMQSSVNQLINQRTKVINYGQEQLEYRDRDTVYQRAIIDHERH